MDATLHIGKLRKRVEVCGLELRKLTILENERRHRMLLGELFEDVLCSRDDLAFAILHRLRKEHLVEEDIAELFRGVDIETVSGIGVNAFGKIIYIDSKAIGHLTGDS